MAHYCRTAKDPTLSLTHHRLVQLLIQRGFAQQIPPVNNPPINSQLAAEVPEILEEQQQQKPPVSPEIPHCPPTRPISPPTIPESSYTTPESSTSALHILIDDSEPENVPCPIIQERPPRKRKQAPPFPPFLWKKRIRASTRPPLMTTTLDAPTIRLTPRAPPTFPTPGSLPIPATGAATQEPVAQDTVTPFVSYKIAETATHSVAEAQEQAEAQVIATAETQEPTANIDIDLRNQMPRHHSS
jgi:hypothetical protein